MTDRTQLHLSSVASALTVIMLSFLLLLAFYVPRLLSAWEAADRELNFWEMMLARLSTISIDFGWPLLALFAMMLCASLAWRIYAGVKLRQRRA